MLIQQLFSRVLMNQIAEICKAISNKSLAGILAHTTVLSIMIELATENPDEETGKAILQDLGMSTLEISICINNIKEKLSAIREGGSDGATNGSTESPS